VIKIQVRINKKQALRAKQLQGVSPLMLSMRSVATGGAVTLLCTGRHDALLPSLPPLLLLLLMLLLLLLPLFCAAAVVTTFVAARPR
jgi:hypothetical protein